MKVQILTNIPEFLTFKFNSWKRWENQGKNGAYVTYSIGVEHKGVDEYFTVYEKEYNDIFSKLGDLQGRTLEVGKFQDGKYTNWQIKENGQDITPQRLYNAPQSPTSHPEPSNIHPPAQFDSKALEVRIATAFAKRDKQIGEQLEMIMDLKQKLSYMTQLFKDHSKEAYEIHKSEMEEPKEIVSLDIEEQDIPILTAEDLKNFGK